MTDPRVSVIMPSYNHARFIAVAIRSVLAQTVEDIELVVVDDGSADGSQEVIASIGDPRLRHHFLPVNGGACAAMNTALRMSRGKLVAVCNSDDEWLPDKLALQLRVIGTTRDIGAVFTDVEWVDEQGGVASDVADNIVGVFRQRNRAKSTWFRDLLEHGNCLCHPSVLIRREVYDRVGLYDNRLRQLPDYDMWLRVVRDSEIFVMPDKLVRFRRHPENTSRWTPEIMRRSMNELHFILERNFLGLRPDQFAEAFGTRQAAIEDDFDLRIEKALWLVDAQCRHRPLLRHVAMRILFDVLGEEDGERRLRERYGFSVLDFQREMAETALGVDSPRPGRKTRKARRRRAKAQEQAVAVTPDGGEVAAKAPENEVKRLREIRKPRRTRRRRGGTPILFRQLFPPS